MFRFLRKVWTNFRACLCRLRFRFLINFWWVRPVRWRSQGEVLSLYWQICRIYWVWIWVEGDCVWGIRQIIIIILGTTVIRKWIIVCRTIIVIMLIVIKIIIIILELVIWRIWWTWLRLFPICRRFLMEIKIRKNVKDLAKITAQFRPPP